VWESEGVRRKAKTLHNNILFFTIVLLSGRLCLSFIKVCGSFSRTATGEALYGSMLQGLSIMKTIIRFRVYLLKSENPVIRAQFFWRM
jgi:hypothetical protein